MRELASVRVEINDQQQVFERLRGLVYIPVRIRDHGRTVKHQRILSADDVEVGDGGFVLFDTRAQQVITLRVLLTFERRRIRHQHDLRARRNSRSHRIRVPNVFANDQANLDAIHFKNTIFTIRIHHEITTFIEHGVVRQFALAVGVLNASIAQHAGRVVNHSAGRFSPTDDRRNACDVLRQCFN